MTAAESVAGQFLVLSRAQLVASARRIRGPARGHPAELLATLEATLQEASAVLSRLTDAGVLRTFHIQGYAVTGLYAADTPD